jgi:membrane protein
VARSFFDDEGLFLSGALAYQIFFALIPLLALLVGVLGFIYGDESSSRRLAQLLREVYPSATQNELRIVRDLIQGRALSLSLGLIGTIFGATAIHSSLDSALAAVFGRTARRTFVRSSVAAVGFIAAILFIAVISFAVSYGAAAAQELLRGAGLGREARTAVGLLGPLVGIAGGYLFFLVIYLTVPRRKVSARAARIAALVSAVLWELAKLAFGIFTREIGAFTAYGPLAFAAGLLTWIYLTGAIILIGAEVIKAMRSDAAT